MQYKGYTGVTEVDEEAGLIFGHVVGLRDVITFQGTTVAKARKSFEESVEFYLEMCKEDGTEPEKPFSGKIMLRVPPELHRALASVAEQRRVSLNKMAIETLWGVVKQMELDAEGRIPRSVGEVSGKGQVGTRTEPEAKRSLPVGHRPRQRRLRPLN